jgi:hypothetical protein
MVVVPALSSLLAFPSELRSGPSAFAIRSKLPSSAILWLVFRSKQTLALAHGIDPSIPAPTIRKAMKAEIRILAVASMPALL